MNPNESVHPMLGLKKLPIEPKNLRVKPQNFVLPSYFQVSFNYLKMNSRFFCFKELSPLQSSTNKLDGFPEESLKKDFQLKKISSSGF